ncbi:Glutamine synthetase [Granulibacter bethesdensis CGDNIH4]|nr:Glutamine synthetase [Granulibacter bethesdensis CGDNIH4]
MKQAVLERKTPMATILSEEAKKRGIRYFLISYVDLFGTNRAKLVPAAAIDGMVKSGAGFAGFASWLDLTPAHPDVNAVPDPDSLIQLPWKPEVGWLAADLHMGGKILPQGPRNVLKKMKQDAAEKGITLKTGVEPEFFLLDPSGTSIGDTLDTSSKPCYDQGALMRRYDVISEICDYMTALGWGPYQNDHEDGNGQFEMNWNYADALITADRTTFFKYMVRTIAEKHGLRATFMPKPFLNRTGSGCHMHMSLWNGESNLLDDPADSRGLGLSALGYHFISGLMECSDALCAITNPTVNSFKRIIAPPGLSGSTWAPNTVTYAGDNRTHMIRVPAGGRMEIRLPDNAANPYLLPAAILAAGLYGIETKGDPGEPLDIDMYRDTAKLDNVRRLPGNLLDALRALKGSEVIRAAFGPDVVDSYVKLRQREWDEYMYHLTDWERQQTLDC